MSRKKTNKTNPHIGGELAVEFELRVTALDATCRLRVQDENGVIAQEASRLQRRVAA